MNPEPLSNPTAPLPSEPTSRAKPIRPTKGHATQGHATKEPRRPLRLLVVEDEEDAAELLADLLRMQGHAVKFALCGRDALETLRAEGADLVLCDLGLPDMNGLELARAIREDSGLRAVRLVAMSGNGQPGDLERSAKAGFDMHLVKPLEHGALNALIGRLTSSVG
jgi:CheY-like chemotaxis protein